MASTESKVRPCYRILAAAEGSDEVDIMVYDSIGQDMWGDGVSAEDLVDEIAGIKAKTLNVRINSFGGQVFEGLAIYNALDRHPANIVTHIDGIAASIASIIALAGSEVRIAENAFMMIHNPHGVAVGNARDMREMADVLEKVGGSLSGVYARKTGLDDAQIQAWMDAETWFTAEEALEAGLVDAVTEKQQVMAALDPEMFASVPPRIAAQLVPKDSKTVDARVRVSEPQHSAPTSKAPTGQEESMSDTTDKVAPDNGAVSKAMEDARAEALREERERQRAIRSVAQDFKIEDEMVDRWINSGATIEAVNAAALQAVKDRQAARPDVRVGADREAEAPFNSFGEQLQAIINADPKMQSEFGTTTDKRLLHHNRIYGSATGMSQGDPSSGGFTVAPQFSQMIWDGLNANEDNLLSRVDAYPVEGESLTFNANAETSRATGSRWGGVQSYWLAEADQITASKPKFRQAKVEPQELAVMVYLTNKLLRNSGAALEQYVSRAAISEIGFMSSEAIIRGTGAGKPLGLLNSASLVTVAAEGSQAASTILHQNISKMWARLHPNARRDAIWLHNVDIEPELDNLFLAVTNVAGTENVGGLSQMLYQQGQRTLKGRPLVPCEFCSTLGTVGDLILWSPSGYLAGIRAGIESEMSIHIRFDYAETAFRFMYEVDGQPWLASALTPYQGSNTLSTHVALATRS